MNADRNDADAALNDDYDLYNDAEASDRRRLIIGGIFVFSVAVLPILFLTALLQGLTVPSWVFMAQAGTGEALHDLSPYLLVFVFGTLVGIAELVSAFPERTIRALGTLWGVLLVQANAFGTLIAYTIVRLYASSFDHPLIRAGLIAAGFAIMLRTRFVIARSLNPNAGGVALDFGWLYRQFQNLCHERISQDLMSARDRDIVALTERFAPRAELVRLAEDAISTGSERAEADRARLVAIREADLPEPLILARLAELILDTGGRDHARFLLLHARKGDTGGAQV